MADYTLVQDADTTISLTPSVSPLVGSTVVWVMIGREKKDALITNSQSITSGANVTTISVTITSTDIAAYRGAYYYELWEHRPSGTPQRLLDSGSVIITPTYGGSVTA